jgi:hypothetical protein
MSFCYYVRYHNLLSCAVNDLHLCITGILIIWNVTILSILVLECAQAESTEISHGVVYCSRAMTCLI